MSEDKELIWFNKYEIDYLQKLLRERMENSPSGTRIPKDIYLKLDSMLKFSYDWSRLRKEMSEDMQDIIKRYPMYSKEILIESFEKEVLNMETLANGPIDGFILSIAKETLKKQDFHHIQETIDLGMPVVLFDRVFNDLKCDRVIVDDKGGAEAATTLLIDKGRKNILLLTTQDYINVGNLRTQGYLEALKKNQIVPDNNLIIKYIDNLNSEQEMIDLEKQIDSLLDKNIVVDAVFAVNEIYAASALKVMRKRNIKVPEQVAIICFTDGVISRYSSPSLSTVSQHAEQIGEASAELLINKLTQESSLEDQITKVIKCSIIERESS